MANYLFIHGLFGDSHDWAETVHALEGMGNKCHCIDIDYINKKYETFSILSEEIFDNAKNHFSTTDFIAVGHSLGGVLAIYLGHKAKLVIPVASFSSFDARPCWLGRSESFFHRELSRIFSDVSALPVNAVAKYQAVYQKAISSREEIQKLKAIKKLIKNLHLDREYTTNNAKITFICGANDKLSPVSFFEEIKMKYNIHGMHIINKCGHAIPLEKPLKLAWHLSFIEKANN